eukprot:scaffold112241_cov25-Prasinocladus_malaysianus.AAC.2
MSHGQHWKVQSPQTIITKTSNLLHTCVQIIIQRSFHGFSRQKCQMQIQHSIKDYELTRSVMGSTLQRSRAVIQQLLNVAGP